MNDTTWPPAVTPINNLEDLSEVFSADRAIVLMSVEWSSPERVGRQRFRELIERLRGEGVSNVEFFVVNEDVDGLRTHFPITIESHCAPLGAGTLHWLERGAVIASEVSAGALSIERLVEKSIALWPVGS